MATLPGQDLMARLRVETQTEHKRAESSEFEQALVSGRVTRPLYVAYLEQRYHIHAALEPAVLDLVRSQARLGDLIPESLRQSGNLSADLAHLGISTPADALPPTREFVTELGRLGDRGCVSLLGAYYVFEGSKNGARFIAKAVQRALGLSGPDGLRYLDPHGAAQRELWAAFKGRMNAVEFTRVEQDLMVGGAKRAFAAVHAIDSAVWDEFSQQMEAAT